MKVFDHHVIDLSQEHKYAWPKMIENSKSRLNEESESELKTLLLNE